MKKQPKLPSSYLEPKIFDNKYIVKEQLSSGSFGVVYLAIHKVTREEVAVKLEKGQQETLDREVYLLTKLQGINGITKLFWFGREQCYNVMVIEILGKDLGYYGKTFKQLSLKSGLQLLEQLITIFNCVHQRGIVHRDLKPENIMMGKINTSQAFLVDFGVSKQIFDKGKHIPFKDKKSFIGTARYASVAAHKGFEIGRKDDLESLMYVIIYLILGQRNQLIEENCLGKTYRILVTRTGLLLSEKLKQLLLFKLCVKNYLNHLLNIQIIQRDQNMKINQIMNY
ncbi:unnamed protein product [Paramecium primaurelia]|uniref:Casein kinase I n=1 Tax=Paramecium primaurelia TaxID=5886 RepID=A0A8S1K871_PARPR|nr:unnamed protein product [Paramecium primaurelia]